MWHGSTLPCTCHFSLPTYLMLQKSICPQDYRKCISQFSVLRSQILCVCFKNTDPPSLALYCISMTEMQFLPEYEEKLKSHAGEHMVNNFETACFLRTLCNYVMPKENIYRKFGHYLITRKLACLLHTIKFLKQIKVSQLAEVQSRRERGNSGQLRTHLEEMTDIIPDTFD